MYIYNKVQTQIHAVYKRDKAQPNKKKVCSLTLTYRFKHRNSGEKYVKSMQLISGVLLAYAINAVWQFQIGLKTSEIADTWLKHMVIQKSARN